MRARVRSTRLRMRGAPDALSVVILTRAPSSSSSSSSSGPASGGGNSMPQNPVGNEIDLMQCHTAGHNEYYNDCQAQLKSVKVR
jgi:hypothetical protein